MNSDPAQNGRRQRPEGINPQDWKNRTRISAKLTPVNYSKLVRWCLTKKFNFNSGINHLITTHPDFQKNG
jgi:hypothetical protein